MKVNWGENMSYFKEISTYATYSGEDADFHFMYNANSGGGQAFLGGKFLDKNGHLVSPETLNGKTAVFKFAFKKSTGEILTVVLNDEVAQYEIKPRGNGSTSMKLGIGYNRIAPSKAISTFMMLPPTCGVKMPNNLERSILSSSNYWLQSMWLECSVNSANQNKVLLQPKDLVFCGGINKDTSNEDGGRYFSLDVSKRLCDIVDLSQKTDMFSESIASAIGTFVDVYLGNQSFEYNKCDQAIKTLMTTLAAMYPERYSGITDPLPVLLEIAFEEQDTLCAGQVNPAQYEDHRLTTGCNVLLYGVPGSGKSWTIEHEYCKKGSKVERLVFHPDYTYSDFIGQILPDVAEDGQVSYKFAAGPFTNILREAYMHPDTEYILIIEEINRGNAPAIFGEVFQLLDRKVEIRGTDGDGYPIGTSEYGITNANIAKIVYGDPTHKVRIPSNLSVIGTMNTSDQNVFTLDTAFQRRWDMRLIENNFDNVDPALADAEILDTTITWKNFCIAINGIVVGNSARMTSSEDKRLGAYFVHIRDLAKDDRLGNHLTDGTYDDLRKKEFAGTLTGDEKTQLANIRDAMKQYRKFPEKVIKYLWDDAFKFNREVVFENTEYQTLEQIIRTFMYAQGNERFKMFKENVVSAFKNPER